MKITTANRINTVKEYYFSKKLREIAALNTDEFPVINLGIGSPDLGPDKNVIETLIKSAAVDAHHAYQSYKGIPELRKSIAEWYQRIYNVNLNPETEVLPLMGSKEGIMHISMTYLNDGDEVLVPNPGYPTYSSATKLAGGTPIYYNLTDENNWDISIEEIESFINDKTKLMWVNFPHMPTGKQGNFDTLNKLIELAKKHNVLIINDNPYSLTLNDHPKSLLSLDKDVVIELNSLSKSHNMAGWRMGMILGNEERINEILRFKSNMDSGMFLPIQHAAISALDLNSAWTTELNKTYKKRRLLAWELLDLLDCKYDKNQVGMFVWAKIPDTHKDCEELSGLILKKSKVFITPGHIFGSNGNKYVRISLCKKETIFMEAINRIKTIKQ